VQGESTAFEDQALVQGESTAFEDQALVQGETWFEPERSGAHRPKGDNPLIPTA